MLQNVRAKGPLQFKSSKVTSILLVASACIFATTTGFDAALMNGINIMPSYTQTLKLTTTTKSLNTAAGFIGSGFVSLWIGPVVNHIGRKRGIMLSIIFKLLGVVFMSAAQNVGMFVLGRVLLGMGTGTSGVAASTWLAETLSHRRRGIGLSAVYTVWYVGALISAGVTYRTANIEGEWSWRLPCLLQGLFSFACAAVLAFVPESPRWLAYQGRFNDALEVVASMQSDGDTTEPLTQAQYREMIDTIEWERAEGKQLNYKEMLASRGSRKRVMLAVSVAVIAMMSGNNIVSYYLGDMLTAAGITSTQTKLEINVILNAWCFVCALTGTLLMDRIGRKTMCLLSCMAMATTLFIVGALTKGELRVVRAFISKVYGHGHDTSGTYGTIASIFLFQGSYGIGITPLTVLYPPEVLNYSIRSNGMAAWTMAVNISGVIVTFIFPFGLAAISWKLYMINAAWDVLQFIFVLVFWIETKGFTLEEIDRLIDGTKHSSVPDIVDLQNGTAVLEGKGVDSTGADVDNVQATKEVKTVVTPTVN